MSVTVCWRPIPLRDARYLEHFIGSTGLGQLRDTFGSPHAECIQLDRTAIPMLRGMAVTGSKAFGEIADILEEHHAIEIWGEW